MAATDRSAWGPGGTRRRSLLRSTRIWHKGHISFETMIRKVWEILDSRLKKDVPDPPQPDKLPH